MGVEILYTGPVAQALGPNPGCHPTDENAEGSVVWELLPESWHILCFLNGSGDLWVAHVGPALQTTSWEKCVSKLVNYAKACLAAAAFVAASSANAVLIGTGGVNPYTFSWSEAVTGGNVLTGNGSMTVSGFNSGLLSITITLNNTSAIGGQGGERLTGFAFGIDPNATGTPGFVDANDGGMVAASFASGALAANVQGVEICAFGGQNCSGGSNGGIFAGGTDTFTVLLLGSWGSSVDIAPLGVRYQTGYGSFTFDVPGGGGGGGKLPEPGTLGLLGLGVLGLAAFRRRVAA